jgi:hypothetical protein
MLKSHENCQFFTDRSDSSSSCIAQENTQRTQKAFEVTVQAAMNTVRLKFTPKQGEQSVVAKPRNAMLHSTRLLMSREQKGQRLRQLRGDQILNLPQSFLSKLDRNLERVPSLVRALRSALQARDMGLIIDAVRAITLKLVDQPSVSLSGRPPTPVTDFPGEIDHRVQRLDRYYFTALGGPELMLQLFQRPFALPDVREMKPHLLARRIDVWCEVLVLLRELCFTDHDLSARLTGDSFLMQLFTMMSEVSATQCNMCCYRLMLYLSSCSRYTASTAGFPRCSIAAAARAASHALIVHLQQLACSHCRGACLRAL